VWWSPDLGTVLANEEVEEWKSKGHTVERRPLRQWMLRITKYAQRLIDELDTLDWPDGIKALQRNWIGRSEGAEVHFTINEQIVTVFTTRPDTLFGATYMVLAPEHPLVPLITTPEQNSAVQAYQKACTSKSDMDRCDLNKDKSGVNTGAFAKNPANNQLIPVWIADYVMMSYGTGAIMAVPAHDERDFEFAQKFNLPIQQVVAPTDDSDWQNYTKPGTAVNSGFLDGLSTSAAKITMIDWLESNQLGRRRIQYKLRDWLFSRQRYWGEPFPILWKEGHHYALSESDLPLLAPPLEDYKPNGTPDPLLSKAKEWVNLPDGSIRETNTMPQWAGSCWYYLRYCDPKNTNEFISEDALNYWATPNAGMVDLYVGGTEHAVLHLLYSRFWHKVLYDLGYVNSPEPFQKLVNQGLILGEDGQKMSKSCGNVVNPDDVISEYGADSLRLYEMFMGPLEQVKPWQTQGVEGVYRFLARVWRLAFEDHLDGSCSISPKIQDATCNDKELLRVLHDTIKKVGEDIEKLSFNTAISHMMTCSKAFSQAEVIPKSEFFEFLKILNPFAPHITEEIHAKLGGTSMLSEQTWPIYDPQAIVRSEIEFIVQINGKLRERMILPINIDEESAKKAALDRSKIQDHLTDKTIRKIIFVPGKLINIVAN
jgi:leucyl-tRNA synthetase